MQPNHTHTISRSAGWRSVLSTTSAALLMSTAAAHADDWRFSVTPYLWATDIGVEAKLDGRQVVDEQISVSDLLEDINSIFQGRLEAQHGDFGAMIDLFDVTLSDDVSDIALPDGAGQADMSSDVGMTLLDVAGVYDPRGDHQGFALLYGTRLLNERATVDATLELADSSTIPQSYETDDWTVDGLIGMRFGKRFSSHWSYQMQADLSTGGTDYTWSIGPSLSYAFGEFGRFGVTAGYRRMVIDFEDEDGLDAQMTMSGALISFRTSF